MTYNFTLFDTNLETNFTVECDIKDDNSSILNNTTTTNKYLQKYSVFTSSSCNEYSKTFFIDKDDSSTWESVWNPK